MFANITRMIYNHTK